MNPTFEESAHSDLELNIAGTADYISMVEAGADEISEEDMLAAMTFGQEAIAAFCEKQAAFLAKVNPEPLEYTIRSADPCIAERVEPFFDRMSAALKAADKLARMGKVEDLKACLLYTSLPRPCARRRRGRTVRRCAPGDGGSPLGRCP